MNIVAKLRVVLAIVWLMLRFLWACVAVTARFIFSRKARAEFAAWRALEKLK